jgi:acetate kinase
VRIIVCNIGSSSFKMQLLDMPGEQERIRGVIERVGSEESSARYRVDGNEVASEPVVIASQAEAVRHALRVVETSGVLGGLDEIDAVGFKTVQAGEENGSVLLTDRVLAAMERYQELAPAHNPPYLAAIRMFRELLPETPLVGVFEPGFHRSIPDYARVYGTPYEWIVQNGVVKYGYHGASHRYVTGETVRILGLKSDRHRIISCHLGGSSSLCAFKDGRSIDTSMGFTPQSGLIQGTRIGDMDPFVLPYIMKARQLSLEDALQECSSGGGLKGLSGISADMRDIKAAADGGDPRALLARRKFIYDIKRYVGEFLVLMEGLDAITFTGGIGQRDANLRAEVLSSLGFLGLRFNAARNASHERLITEPGSPIAALVLETNEELVVARETMKVILQSP